MRPTCPTNARAPRTPARRRCTVWPTGGRGRVPAAYGSGRMHHAWLLSGPMGVGKATLAWRIARFLLAGDGGRHVRPARHAGRARRPPHRAPPARGRGWRAAGCAPRAGRQGQPAPRHHGRCHAPPARVFRAVGHRWRAARGHCRCRRRDEPERRQCPAESAGRAARQCHAAAGRASAVAAAAHDPLALPGFAAVSAGRRRFRRARCAGRGRGRPGHAAELSGGSVGQAVELALGGGAEIYADLVALLPPCPAWTAPARCGWPNR